MKYEKTHHVLIRQGETVGHVQTDTIFIDSVPHLVFEWDVYPDGTEKPSHPPVALDPSKHHVIGWDNCKYMYELPVEDPRKMH